MIPGVPHHTITADEQAAILADTTASMHPTDWPGILCGTPAWVALDVLRHAGGWVTWEEWMDATRHALWWASGGAWPTGLASLAREAAMAVGRLHHREPTTGRAIHALEIEDRRSPRDPWRGRARRFVSIHHPPLAAARWIHIPEPTRPQRAPEHVGQLSLLEAA